MNDMTKPGALADDNAPQTVTVARPTVQLSAVSGLAAQAEAFTITDDDTAQMAADELQSIAQTMKNVEDERVTIKKPLLEATRALDAMFKKITDPLEAAGRVYRRKLVAFQDEQDRKRREEQARADAEARAAKEKLAKDAERLEKKGKVEEAEAKREVAAMIPDSYTPPPAAKVGGVTFKTTWKARFKEGSSKRDLIKFIAEHPEFDYLLDFNESKANAHAKQCEKADLGIACLEGYQERGTAVR